MKKMPGILAGVVAILAASGCSSLKISVYQYKGDLAHSLRTRLADARGKANDALAKIESNAILKKHFDDLAGGAGKFRTPRQYMEVIHAVREDFDATLKGGVPRPANAKTGESPEERKTREAANAEVAKKISILEKELMEFGSLLEAASKTALPREKGKEEDLILAGYLVLELNTIGKEIQRQVEFPDFGEVIAEEDQWRLINPVYTFGGFGKSEYVVYKDETGNYQLKSAVFDPSDVAQAVRKSALRVISFIASSYGLPLPVGGGAAPGAAMDDGTLGTFRLQTGQLAAALSARQSFAATLESELKARRKEHLEVPAGGVLKPGFAAGEAQKALNALLREIEIYQGNLKSLEGGGAK